MRLHLTDDSGILSLIDCSAYLPFVAEDWEYEQRLAHFRAQGAHKSIVVWDAGDGGNNYRIDIRLEATQAEGLREARGRIVVRNGRLHLVSYTALTMAAQYADEQLPAKSEADCCFKLPDGEYAVRIVQMYDPSQYGELSQDDPHFVVEILKSSGAMIENVLWLQA